VQKTGGPILTLVYDVFLRKQWPVWGVAMIVPALKILVALIFENLVKR